MFGYNLTLKFRLLEGQVKIDDTNKLNPAPRPQTLQFSYMMQGGMVRIATATFQNEVIIFFFGNHKSNNQGKYF